MNPLRRLAVYMIQFYRNYLSVYKLNTCKFYPTCSEYAQEALSKYGLLRGGLYASGRLLRCSWFSKGGPDPLN